MKDKGGVTYSGPTSRPATPGTNVTIRTPNGPKSGTMTGGGYVVPKR